MQECPKNPIFQEHPTKIEEAVRTNLEEGVDLIQGCLETSPRDWVFHIFCAHSTPLIPPLRIGNENVEGKKSLPKPKKLQPICEEGLQWRWLDGRLEH